MKSRNIASTMRKTTMGMAFLALATVGSSLAQKPNFTAAVWGDGQVWGTKGTTTLPAPNDHNAQSFDVLIVIINSNAPEGQLPVAEAAPGNTAYNGGRWATVTAWWTEAGFVQFGTVPVVASYAEFLTYYMMGYIDYEMGPPEGGPPAYFQCPLLPVK